MRPLNGLPADDDGERVTRLGSLSMHAGARPHGSDQRLALLRWTAAVVGRRRRRRRITRKRDEEEEKTGGKLQVSLRTSGRRGQEKEITCSEVTGDVHVRTKGQREEKMHEQHIV